LPLAIIVFAAKAARAMSARAGQPAVFGEIQIGLQLGPTAIDLPRLWPFTSADDSLGSDLKDFSEIVVIQFIAPASRPHE
jgi:Kef-type K+ transport system membrane component KefB